MTHYLCSVCQGKFDENGVKLSDVTLKAHHTYVKVPSKAATCKTEGNIAHRICSVCNKLFNEKFEEITSVKIEKLEHTYSSYGKDENSHWGVCSCGEKGETSAHSYKETVIKEATNKEEGLLEKSCICGDKHEVTIPKTKGCSGSVVGSLISVISLAGAVVVFRRKKREE